MIRAKKITIETMKTITATDVTTQHDVVISEDTVKVTPNLNPQLFSIIGEKKR